MYLTSYLCINPHKLMHIINYYIFTLDLYLHIIHILPDFCSPMTSGDGVGLHNQGEKLYAYDFTINIQQYNFSRSVIQQSPYNVESDELLEKIQTQIAQKKNELYKISFTKLINFNTKLYYGILREYLGYHVY